MDNISVKARCFLRKLCLIFPVGLTADVVGINTGGEEWLPNFWATSQKHGNASLQRYYENKHEKIMNGSFFKIHMQSYQDS